MEKNVCGVDRAARAVLGLLLVVILIRTSGRSDVEDATISLPKLLTVYALAELSVNVFAQWCPLNALLGIDTCRPD